MTEINLTYKEISILEYIRKFQSEKGYAPSMREISRDLGIRSMSMISWYLSKLEKAGRIKRDKSVARSIVVTDQAEAEASTTSR